MNDRHRSQELLPYRQYTNSGPDLASISRENTHRQRQLTARIVACPRCQGEAWAELSPTTAQRPGEEPRTFCVVTCHNGCRKPARRAVNNMRAANSRGFQRTIPARFEIPVSELIPMHEAAKAAEVKFLPPYRAERALVLEAITAAGTNPNRLSLELGMPQLRLWIRRGPVGELGQGNIQRVLDWAQGVLEARK